MILDPGCSILKKAPDSRMRLQRKAMRLANKLCSAVTGSRASKPQGRSLLRKRGRRNVSKLRHGGAKWNSPTTPRSTSASSSSKTLLSLREPKDNGALMSEPGCMDKPRSVCARNQTPELENTSSTSKRMPSRRGRGNNASAQNPALGASDGAVGSSPCSRNSAAAAQL